MFYIIARIVETLATRKALRLSREHAARRMARLEREAVEAFTRETFARVAARHPYPFHG